MVDQELFNVLMSFRSPDYTRHNFRRLEHLSTLGLDLAGSRVLELGAGISDHTTFFLDRKCSVDSVEPRPENCALFRQSIECHPRRSSSRLFEMDVETAATALRKERYDIVYCYGLLYHVQNPIVLLQFASDVCEQLLLLETCVSYGSQEAVRPTIEQGEVVTQAVRGTACRPTRPWIFNRLKELFEFAYVPTTQPWHEEFPIDWTPQQSPTPNLKARAIFLGSRSSLENPLLVSELPDRQDRC